MAQEDIVGALPWLNEGVVIKETVNWFRYKFETSFSINATVSL